MELKKIINVEKIKLGNVPCLYVRPNFIKGKLPLVILYHGWQSNKERQEFLGKIFAQFGYGVIIPDAISHGERGTLDYNDIQVLRENFWRIIIHSVDEYNLIIKDCLKKLDVDEEKISIMGSSMGGFIASGIFAVNDNIRCLININGACAWENAERLFREEDGIGLSNEGQLETIIKYDPINNKNNLYPRPILLLHGDSDTSIPIETQRYFYEEMIKIYKDKSENIKLYSVSGLNHRKTLDMIEEAVNWLNKHI